MKLLFRVLSAAGKDISHFERVRSDTAWNSIDGTELSRQVALFATNFDKEEGLSFVSDFHLVGSEEVFGD